MVTRTQFRITSRGRDWHAGRPSSTKLFRIAPLAESYLRELHDRGDFVVLAVEERDLTATPWRPSRIGGAR